MNSFHHPALTNATHQNLLITGNDAYIQLLGTQ